MVKKACALRLEKLDLPQEIKNLAAKRPLEDIVLEARIEAATGNIKAPWKRKFILALKEARYIDKDFSVLAYRMIKFYHFINGDEKLFSNKEYESSIKRQQILQKVEKMLSILSKRDQNIIMMYFGLLDGKPMSLEGIGTFYGITAERVRQLKEKSIRKLRSPFRGNITHGDDNELQAMCLSTRSYNCLMRAGLRTVKDIINCPKEDWAKVKYLTAENKAEVEQKIHGLGHKSFQFPPL